jgi:hypothetical protein
MFSLKKREKLARDVLLLQVVSTQRQLQRVLYKTAVLQKLTIHPFTL